MIEYGLRTLADYSKKHTLLIVGPYHILNKKTNTKTPKTLQIQCKRVGLLRVEPDDS